VQVGPADQQKRLLHAVAPKYPDVARYAGIQGDVVLRVIIGPDGAVHDVSLLWGEPVLGRAAMEAVEEWRYRPAHIDGWAIRVVTTVTLAFRLE